MARIKIDAASRPLVRRVRQMIQDRLGDDAAVVFGEAIANVREHAAPSPAEITIHHQRLEVCSHTHQAFRRQSVKPSGEGGYGLPLMEALGARVDWCEGRTQVVWLRLPSGDEETPTD